MSYAIHSKEKDRLRITLCSPSLDLDTVPLLRRHLNRLIGEAGYPDVILNISRIQRIDSSGICLMLSLGKELRSRKKDLMIEGEKETFMSILYFMEAERFFTFSGLS